MTATIKPGQDAASPTGAWTSLNEAAFAAAESERAQGGLQGALRQAYDQSRQLPAPTLLDEDWRRTPPSMFPLGRVHRLPSASMQGGALPDHPLYRLFDVIVYADERGYRIVDRSGVLRSERLTIVPGAAPNWSIPGQHGTRRDQKLFWAVEAMANLRFHIRVAPGAALERGVLLHWNHRQMNGLVMPRLTVEVADGAAFTLVEWITSGDETLLVHAGAKDVRVGDGARLKAVHLQQLGPCAFWMPDDYAVAGRNARIDWVTVQLGARASKSRLGLEAAGSGADLRAVGACFASGRQHLDQGTHQIHAASDTTSNLLYKNAIQDEAHTVYQGVILAQQDAQRIDAYQKNHNLLLNDGARADSLPGLLINADDLRCSHGATIGQLDPDHLFYLRSRGLDEAGARRLLLAGFFNDIVERMPYDDLRAITRAALDAKIESFAEEIE